MKIIPVLDILNGQVVQGAQGKRETYQPIRSVLVPDSQPLSVAKTFSDVGFTLAYLADLDAIQGSHLNMPLYQQIIQDTNLSLMIDAGIYKPSQLSEIQVSDASSIIIGSETLHDLTFLDTVLDHVGADRSIISVDLREGKLLAKDPSIQQLHPLDFIDVLVQKGFTRMIILELTSIGAGKGMRYDIVRQVVQQYAVQVFTGGGIRHLQDLLIAQKEGVSGVLLATALHTGSITPSDLLDAGLL